MSIFGKVQLPTVKKSAFDLSHSRKMSIEMGRLYPCFVQECVPGDKFYLNTELFMRLAPLTAPIMHRVNTYVHHFFVPNRIIMPGDKGEGWMSWEEFITGKVQGTLPTVDAFGMKESSLGDYLGLPTDWPEDWHAYPVPVSSLPFRAYAMIWNEYYRDQNLQDEIQIGDSTDTLISRMDPFRRAWKKDYFTSALPYPQAGAPVSIEADIDYAQQTPVVNATTGNPVADGALKTFGGKIETGLEAARIENIEGINFTVEELRRASALQRFLEKTIRGGNRYFEHLLVHWGVKSRDARLQRPEYLGGGIMPVQISDTANTTGTVDAPQSTLSGNGISIGKSNGVTKYCEEHGYIISLLSVMPEPTYQQGIDKHWQRLLMLDNYFPEFANLGEQEVKRKEISLNENPLKNEETFGYQERFAEMKYARSTVHGKFRSELGFWHMGRKFKDSPLLNEEFIVCDGIQDDTEPTGPWRVFAVNESEQLYVHLRNNVKAVRPLPYLSNLTLR